MVGIIGLAVILTVSGVIGWRINRDINGRAS